MIRLISLICTKAPHASVYHGGDNQHTPSRTRQDMSNEEQGVSLSRILVFVNINEILRKGVCLLKACAFTVSLLRSQMNVAGLLMILEGYGLIQLFETGSWIGWCSTSFTFTEPWAQLRFFFDQHEAVMWRSLGQALPLISSRTRGHALFSQWANLNYHKDGSTYSYTGNICSAYIHCAEHPQDLVRK
jgi:hypothetical protein